MINNFHFTNQIDDETEMIVTWVTLKEISDKGHVEYGLEKKHLTNNVKAEVIHFKEDKTEFYTYRAVMTGLTPGVQYRKFTTITNQWKIY